MRIVHVIPRDFRSADDGGRVKTAALATALARCGELEVVSIERAPFAGLVTDWRAEAALPFGGHARFTHCLAVPPAWSPLGKAARRADHALRAGSRHARRGWAGTLAAALAPDVVVADDIACASAALAVGDDDLRAGNRTRRFLHLHNVESALHRARAEALGDARVLKRVAEYAAIERALVPRFDELWGVSTEDLAHFAASGLPAERLRLAPNVVPDAAFAPAVTVGEPGRALYFGSLWWEPNADAARELLALAQRLAVAGERCRWRVAGRGAEAALAAAMAVAPGVEALGFVPDLAAEAACAAAVVIPIAWGGGTKVKTLEAMALAKPIVITPEGAAGLALEDGVHALVRPLGDSFDAAVVEVLRAPSRYAAMAANAQALARERYSQAALDRSVRAALDGAGSRTSSAAG